MNGCDVTPNSSCAYNSMDWQSCDLVSLPGSLTEHFLSGSLAVNYLTRTQVVVCAPWAIISLLVEMCITHFWVFPTGSLIDLSTIFQHWFESDCSWFEWNIFLRGGNLQKKKKLHQNFQSTEKHQNAVAPAGLEMHRAPTDEATLVMHPAGS